MVSLVREWVLFILSFIPTMGSREAVLSARGVHSPVREWVFVYFVIHITMDSREVGLSGSVSSDTY